MGNQGESGKRLIASGKSVSFTKAFLSEVSQWVSYMCLLSFTKVLFVHYC